MCFFSLGGQVIRTSLNKLFLPFEQKYFFSLQIEDVFPAWDKLFVLELYKWRQLLLLQFYPSRLSVCPSVRLRIWPKKTFERLNEVPSLIRNNSTSSRCYLSVCDNCDRCQPLYNSRVNVVRK